MTTIRAADIPAAFDRLADFLAVQRVERGGPTLDGVVCLQEAVGVREHERRALARRLPEVTQEADAAAVLLGVVIGLLAAEPR